MININSYIITFLNQSLNRWYDLCKQNSYKKNLNFSCDNDFLMYKTIITVK